MDVPQNNAGIESRADSTSARSAYVRKPRSFKEPPTNANPSFEDYAKSALTSKKPPAHIDPPAWVVSLQKSVNETRAVLRDNHLSTLRCINALREDGTDMPYEIIPLPNGVKPTDEPHALAPIRNADAIRKMNGDVLNQYLTFYQVGDPGQYSLRVRRGRLATAIGISTRFST
ncbi:hypothetical protein BOTBODRAFT_49870 [Botryobasidium botryosum FD-172 SS1]|uniref:Mug135-like C-terminal domain-containing protein n=1 Tax=Botryobasidium botryosum (strain FD-172 SS1) TaxID=930990 RepID=A0A067N2I8_BOTB1|nr:hypothetical protein BOTBODRAFT_49870 [Botryobasidium botryosum FD-172 SS1]